MNWLHKIRGSDHKSSCSYDYMYLYINGLVQETNTSSALAMEYIFLVLTYWYVHQDLNIFTPISLQWHYISIMVSQSSTTKTVQQHAQGNIKGNVKAPHYWPLVRGTHYGQWIPLTKWWWYESVHVMKPSSLLPSSVPYFSSSLTTQEVDPELGFTHPNSIGFF